MPSDRRWRPRRAPGFAMDFSKIPASSFGLAYSVILTLYDPSEIRRLTHVGGKLINGVANVTSATKIDVRIYRARHTDDISVVRMVLHIPPDQLIYGNNA